MNVSRETNIDILKLGRFDGKISGENVKQIRKALGLTQIQFAKLLRMKKGGQGKVSEIEHGKRELTEIQVEMLYWFHIAAVNSENTSKTRPNP